MPDHFAHTLFARRVVDAAGGRLPLKVDAGSPAFLAGGFGPDPLFNDPGARRRAEGFELHRMPGRISLDRMREPVRRGMPRAAEYAAGFFCHYALDRMCHPRILEMAARGEIRHVPLEAAWDRMLMQREGFIMPRRIQLSREELSAAAQMYTRVGPERYRMDLEGFWQLRRMVARGGGMRISALPGRLKREWDGLIPHAEPDAATLRGMDMLDALMEAAVPAAAEQLIAYFTAMLENRPPDPWTDADFSGFQTRG